MASWLLCLPRSRRKSSERKPLLPTYHNGAIPNQGQPLPLYKIADILGALQKGKLPSQDQLNIILHTILKSDLLRDEAQVVTGYGPLSRTGRRVLEDIRETVQAILQIGMEKNVDDKFQDLVYHCSKIDGPMMHIEANTAIDASREHASQLHAQVPSPSELISDTSTLLASLPSLLQLLLTSTFFRLLLSDIRQLLAGLAADVATVAAKVQVAAEEVEAVDVENGWFNVLQDGVNDVTQAIGELDPAAETQKTAKDIFISRVQELIVRAHQDPQTLLALRTIHFIISKHTQKLSCATNIISDLNANSSTTNAPSATSRGPEVTVTPAPETSQALDDLRLFLERFASGRSLDTLLRTFSDTVQNILESSTNPINKDLRNFFHDVDSFFERALSPSLPSTSQKTPHQTSDLYISSRRGKHALEKLYEHGSVIFLTDDTSTNNRNAKPKWRTSLQALFHESDAYFSAIPSDRSTAKLMRSVDKLCASGSDLLKIMLGAGITGAQREIQSRQAFVKDLIGWFIPRMGKLFLRLIPIPRLEFRSGKVEGALEFGLAGAGVVEVKSELLPDSVVLRSWNEIRVDVVPASEGMNDEGYDVRTASNNRIHIHVEGVRFSAHDIGYFVRYNNRWPWIRYVDQGLVSVDVGHDGLAVDIELEIDAPVDPIVGDNPGEQELLPFRVVAVKSSLPGLMFTLSKSKHYILNKLFIQPLAGPLVSKVLTGLLEEQMRRALVGLATAWGEVKGGVRDKSEQREGSDEGWIAEYAKMGVKKVASLFQKEDKEPETHTRATMQGLMHTSTRVDVARDQGMSPEQGGGRQGETVVAVGAGAQLFPDEAGAYGENDTRPAVEDIIGEVIEQGQVAVNETRELIGSVAEVREGVERAERRRKQRVRFEGIYSGDDSDDGWRSAAFDL